MPDISRLGIEVTSKGINEAATGLNGMAAAGEKADKQTSSMMDKFRNLQSIMQGPVAAFNAVKGVMTQIYAAGKDLVDSYAVQERAVSNLEAVLLATGGTVGKTSEELQAMAASLQQATLYGDEAIINMNAVLLGFRSIRGDQFDRATESILNMSTVMGTDLVSSANMLGKALDSPTQGMAALSRVGFVWSDQQREMVKQMEESGDLMGAQNVILEEMEKAFGGAARAAGETATGAFVQLGNALGDLKEQFGAFLSDGMEPFLRDALDTLNEFISTLDNLRKGQNVANDIAGLANVVSSGRGDQVFAAAQGLSLDQLREAYQLAVKMNPLANTAQAGAIRALEQIISGMVRAEEAARKAAEEAAKIVPESGPSENALHADKVLADMRERLRLMELEARLRGEEVSAEEKLNVVISARMDLKDANTQSIALTEGMIEALKLQIAEEERLVRLYGQKNEITVTQAKYIQELAERNERLAASQVAVGDTFRKMGADILMMVGSGSLDALQAFGQFMHDGADGADSFKQEMADIGISILEQLPQLLFYAGVQLLKYDLGIGLGLIAASGLVALGYGLSGAGGDPNASASAAATSTAPDAVTRSDSRQLAAAPTNVVVNNNSSATASAAVVDTNGEREIVVTVENVVRSMVPTGKLDGLLQRGGISPRGVRT